MRIHLVRHGEVHNPGHVVYADIPGYRLSPLGREQAVAAGARLADVAVGRIVSSPLERATQTAEAIAFRHDLPISIDDRLTEWRLSSRWAGIGWEALPERFPGELEAYLANPAELPFSPESIEAVSLRMRQAIGDALEGVTGDLVVVSHQDPVQAARFGLIGRPFEELNSDKPGHASIVTLDIHGTAAVEIDYWEPDGNPFPPPAD